MTKTHYSTIITEQREEIARLRTLARELLNHMEDPSLYAYDYTDLYQRAEKELAE